MIGSLRGRRRELTRRPDLGCDRARALVEVLHRVVDAVELAPLDGEIARHARAGRDHDRVVRAPQLGRLDVDTDLDAVAELDALGLELREPALDEPLLDLELGHAEPDEAAGGLVSLEHRHRVAGPVELLRARETGRAGADDGDRGPGSHRRWPRHDPTLVPGAIDDRDLDLLDRDGLALPDLEHAGGLTRRRAQPAGELGEVVRPMQLDDRLLPAVAVDEVVPVGNQVPERAAVVAERNAALHAPRTLVPQLEQRQRPDELAHVLDALRRIALERLGPVELEKRAELTHYAASSLSVVKKPPPPVETALSSRSIARSASARL